MRTILFLSLLILSLATAAQNHLYSRDSSVIRKVVLPADPIIKETANGPLSKADYIYLLSDHDVYNLFGYDSMKQFRNVDFSALHILGIRQCKQCLRVCNHDNGHKACHRNVCMKEWSWYMRRNQSAFAAIPVISPTAPTRIGGDDMHEYHLRDTIIQPTPGDKAGTARWQTSGMGDCHGSFSYELLQDRFHPVLLLKESSYYGGCRAAGGIHVSVVFKPVAGIQYYLKNTVLVER
ncbi:MAG: hypothetical protein NTW29_12375 [Bacteroidetes bacterium]|nr:hypothetical protein [Bacteroidota bacterium]